MLSTDSVPSTDDLPLSGTSADVTLGPLASGGSRSITKPNLTIPADARLGPQYLILAAVDLGDTNAGIGIDAQPITIEQCPAAGACDRSYSSEAAYLASPELSSGSRPYGRHAPRPAFVADKANLATRGMYVGGREGSRALLLRYDTNRRFSWGRALSHCGRDNLDFLALFDDGTVAATTTYTVGEQAHSALSAYSPAGALLWHRVVASSPNCNGCTPVRNAVVAVDPGDDTVAVATSNGLEGPVLLVRYDRYGNELHRRSHTFASLPIAANGGPFDISIHRFATTARSNVLLGFANGFALLNGGFGLQWSRDQAALPFNPYPYSDFEVEICTPDDLYVASIGHQHRFDAQDNVYDFDASGRLRWGVNLERGESFGAAPAYEGPQGTLRGDRFALRCNEQDLPEVTFIRSALGGDLPREVRGAAFHHDGSVQAAYIGMLGAGESFAGAVGVAIGGYDFLSLSSNEFRVRSRSAISWAPLP
jgi:hypothetical protein